MSWVCYVWPCSALPKCFMTEAAFALQVYAACRVQLAEALQIKPAPETVVLAARIRSIQARSPGSPLHVPPRWRAGRHPSWWPR